MSSGSSACLCKLLSLQGIFEPTLTERVAYDYFYWLFLLFALLDRTKSTGIYLLWISKKGTLAQRLHRKRELLFLEIPRQKDRRGRGAGIRPCGTGGPASLLECARVPPGAAT